MSYFLKTQRRTNETWLLLFIGAWLLLNVVQAAFVHLDGDEAYYWLYARHLQWGYFDHPPMVALSIKLGELFGHDPLYTRLGTILFSAGTVYVGFKMLPPRLANVRLYLLLFSSVIVFHVYSFIATPDAPLLFFTTLFFYAYRKFLTSESKTTILLLAASITGLLYSKYHGVLPVFFTLLSNPKLLRNGAAWMVVLLVSLAFSPHLWWQYQHHWPTLHYHLSERMSGPYDVLKTSDYIAGQLFIWGLLTTIPALYLFIRKKEKNDIYERAHSFTFWGVLLFFLFSSFYNNIQIHWTLVAGPSFVLLLQEALYNATPRVKKIFKPLLWINIALLLLVRALLIFPPGPVKNFEVLKTLTNKQAWTDTVYCFANGLPVVFVDSYRLPALYLYQYPQAKAWGYSTVNYRKTEFNILNDAFLNNGSVCIASPDPQPDASHTVQTLNNTLYLRRMDSFKAVNALKVTWQNGIKKIRVTKRDTAVLMLVNTGKNAIASKELSIRYSFMKNDHTLYTAPVSFSFSETVLPPYFKKEIRLPLQLPSAGAYRLVFSIEQPTLAGTFASPFYKIAIQ